jgi:integrase
VLRTQRCGDAGWLSGVEYTRRLKWEVWNGLASRHFLAWPSGYGIQAVNKKLEGKFDVDVSRLWEEGLTEPVRFELSEQTRQAVDDYLKAANKRPGEFLFTGRRGLNRNMTTRQYARLVSEWIGSVGLDPRLFGTHSLRRTKATLIGCSTKVSAAARLPSIIKHGGNDEYQSSQPDAAGPCRRTAGRGPGLCRRG